MFWNRVSNFDNEKVIKDFWFKKKKREQKRRISAKSYKPETDVSGLIML